MGKKAWRRRAAMWLVWHVPLGELAPWLLGYAVTGRWGGFQKVEDKR